MPHSSGAFSQHVIYTLMEGAGQGDARQQLFPCCLASPWPAPSINDGLNKKYCTCNKINFKASKGAKIRNRYNQNLIYARSYMYYKVIINVKSLQYFVVAV